MRSQAEIDAEIAALRKLRPVGKHAERTARQIAVAIAVLKSRIRTSQLDDDELDMAMMIFGWKAGLGNKPRPSEGWGRLVERS